MIVMAAMAMTLGLCYGICGWCQTRGTAVVVRGVWLTPLCNAVMGVYLNKVVSCINLKEYVRTLNACPLYSNNDTLQFLLNLGSQKRFSLLHKGVREASQLVFLRQ